MPATPSVTWYRWDEIPREDLSPMIGRKLITGDRMMLAQVFLKKGAVVLGMAVRQYGKRAG